jgi:hypothetical protein
MAALESAAGLSGHSFSYGQTAAFDQSRPFFGHAANGSSGQTRHSFVLKQAIGDRPEWVTGARYGHG